MASAGSSLRPDAARDGVGGKNEATRFEQAAMFEAASIEDPAFLARGFRVSRRYKEGVIKLTASISDATLDRLLSACAEQLGGEIKPGAGPCGHPERPLQLALDGFEDL